MLVWVFSGLVGLGTILPPVGLSPSAVGWPSPAASPGHGASSCQEAVMCEVLARGTSSSTQRARIA